MTSPGVLQAAQSCRNESEEDSKQRREGKTRSITSRDCAYIKKKSYLQESPGQVVLSLLHPESRDDSCGFLWACHEDLGDECL